MADNSVIKSCNTTCVKLGLSRSRKLSLTYLTVVFTNHASHSITCRSAASVNTNTLNFAVANTCESTRIFARGIYVGVGECKISHLAAVLDHTEDACIATFDIYKDTADGMSASVKHTRKRGDRFPLVKRYPHRINGLARHRINGYIVSKRRIYLNIRNDKGAYIGLYSRPFGKPI